MPATTVESESTWQLGDIDAPSDQSPDDQTSLFSGEFDAGPFGPERAPLTPSTGGRMARALLVLGLVAGTAGLLVAAPLNSDSDDAAQGGDTRIEAETPVASADSMTESATEPSGQLADAGDLGDEPSALLTQTGPDVPVIEPIESEPGQTTTTTTWVEPTLPPETDWIDAGNGVAIPDLLLRIRFCESTNNYVAKNRVSTASGAYQFLQGSWDWYGHATRTGVDEAWKATPAQQDEAALATLQAEGTSPWTASRHCWNDPDIDPTYATARPRPTTTTTSTTTTDSTDSTTGESTTTTEPTSTTEPTTTTQPTTTSESTTTTESTTTSESTTTTEDTTTTSTST